MYVKECHNPCVDREYTRVANYNVYTCNFRSDSPNTDAANSFIIICYHYHRHSHSSTRYRTHLSAAESAYLLFKGRRRKKCKYCSARSLDTLPTRIVMALFIFPRHVGVPFLFFSHIATSRCVSLRFLLARCHLGDEGLKIRQSNEPACFRQMLNV